MFFFSLYPLGVLRQTEGWKKWWMVICCRFFSYLTNCAHFCDSSCTNSGHFVNLHSPTKVKRKTPRKDYFFTLFSIETGVKRWCLWRRRTRKMTAWRNPNPTLKSCWLSVQWRRAKQTSLGQKREKKSFEGDWVHADKQLRQWMHHNMFQRRAWISSKCHTNQHHLSGGCLSPDVFQHEWFICRSSGSFGV